MHGVTKSAGGIYRRCGCVDPRTGKAWGDHCPKLAAGRRHGSWYLRLELPVGSDGRRRRIRRGGFTTRKAAEEALAQVRAPSGSGGGLVTVGEWLTHWLATRTGAASTISGYASHVRLYLAPYLGTVVLAELSVAHLQAVSASIAPCPASDGAPEARASGCCCREICPASHSVTWSAERTTGGAHTLDMSSSSLPSALCSPR
ncbi:hypothetical protein ETD83_05605 [Actinomadura soli]|uniref:AP2-like integrase N-terminal domain-containing protein n=1 Tax=Actinomadura soli TaxID=2508997 RepID=A0A5C4JHW7_9ACTN|nr:hypothetical protein ETD83_05605 [Actinomadura soli]